jgi:hypothetical protein
VHNTSSWVPGREPIDILVVEKVKQAVIFPKSRCANAGSRGRSPHHIRVYLCLSVVTFSTLPGND